MFERRLKIFLLILLLLTGMLLARAIHVQVFAHQYWSTRAAGLLQTSQTTATTRGRILDINGKLARATNAIVRRAASDDVADGCKPLIHRALTDP